MSQKLIKKIRENLNKQRRNYNQYHRDTIIKEYYWQLYTRKLDSLEEMEECLETYTFPRLNQEETDYWTLITINEIESIIKNLQQTKDQDHTRIGEFLPNI